MADKKDPVKFKINQMIGAIGEGSRGWRKEVNIVSWNDRAARLDIRDWNETHSSMGKGITLTGSEARTLLNLLNQTDLDALEG